MSPRRTSRSRLAPRPWVTVALAPLLALGLGGCREGSTDPVRLLGLPPAQEGAHGCNGTVQTGQVVLVGTFPWIGGSSQIAADESNEVLYVTGGDGSVRELDLTGGMVVETVLVAPGVLDALLAFAGVPSPAQPSGIALLDPTSLLVVEGTSNTILLVSRVTPDTASFYVGQPNETGGNADGAGGNVRFDFDGVAQLVPAGADPENPLAGTILVADPGNHSVRLLQPGPIPSVLTVAGAEAGFRDGGLARVRFDGPSGLSVTCAGDLLVSERGTGGVAGHRVRSVRLGVVDGLTGKASTLAGDGTPATVQGIDEQASLASPVAPVTTASGEVFWMDSATGILRRWSPATGEVDCPLFPDCASAGGGFTAGGEFALAIGPSGALYVLDAAAATIVALLP